MITARDGIKHPLDRFDTLQRLFIRIGAVSPDAHLPVGERKFAVGLALLSATGVLVLVTTQVHDPDLAVNAYFWLPVSTLIVVPQTLPMHRRWRGRIRTKPLDSLCRAAVAYFVLWLDWPLLILSAQLERAFGSFVFGAELWSILLVQLVALWRTELFNSVDSGVSITGLPPGSYYPRPPINAPPPLIERDHSPGHSVT